MMPSRLNRRAALTFGILIPVLHTVRCILWGRAWPLATWPINADAYVGGAIMVIAALAAKRGGAWGGALITSGWGFAAGLAYRSFFEQLADPSRHGGHEVLVMTVKALVLVGAALGMADVARTVSRSKS